MVNAGLALAWIGHTLPSKRLGTANDRRLASTTLSAWSIATRQPPMRCAPVDRDRLGRAGGVLSRSVGLAADRRDSLRGYTSWPQLLVRTDSRYRPTASQNSRPTWA